MSILIFFLVLFALILVHEWGHFIVAKKTGMRVDEFGIGFPPKIFGVKKGETEYSLNALPIGGFVKIYGEDASDPEVVASEGAFASKNRFKQALVLVAGVAMNIIFAWLLFVAVFMIGVPTPVGEEGDTSKADLMVTEIIPESPASEAGLTLGTEITEISAGDKRLTNPTPESFSQFVNDNSGSAISFVYEGENGEETVAITPETGVIENDQDKAAIGVAISLIETKQYAFFGAIREATITTVSSLGAITVGIYNLISNAFTLEADFSSVAGPVGIVGLVGDAAAIGLTSLLTFTAIISLNLAIINMLPFPALDGGRLLFVAIESVTRKTINPKFMAITNMVGFALLLALMLAVTYNDILRIT